MNRDTIITDELWTPSEVVLPVCLCIDTSGTMATTIGGRRTGEYIASKDYGNRLVPVVVGGTSRIEILEKGIQQFYESTFADELARLTVLVSIVTFNDKAKKVQNFVPVVKRDGTVRRTPHFKPEGQTAMGEGINLALDLLDKCKKNYTAKGVDCYQPWLIIMSDGINNGSSFELSIAQERIRDLVNRKKLAVYPFGIGKGADLNQLNQLSPKQEAFQLEETQMEGLFKWFAKSAAQVSSGCIDGYSSPKLEHYEVVSWAAGL
nr:VWA domain-containing protein [uncultured Anaerobutyricum sp.]